MSAFDESLNNLDVSDVNAQQNQLSEALANNDLEEFQLSLDMGADLLIPNDNRVCIYEMALSTYGRAEFVEECLQNGCSPHYVNQRLNKAAVNYAVDSKDPRILNLILSHPNIMVNNKFCHLTPLNSLAINATDDNVDDVIQCMEKLINYGASTSIPDDSGLTPSNHFQHNAKLSDVNKKHILETLEKLENDLINLIRPAKKLHLHPARLQTLNLCALSDESAAEFMSATKKIKKEATLYKFASSDTRIAKPSPAKKEESYFDEDWYNRYLFFNSIRHKDNISFDDIMAKHIDYNHKLDDKTPLECALDAGNCYALKRLLNKSDINIRSVCPLSVVIKHMKDDMGEYRKCFYMLLKYKHIDINETDTSGSTALHYAVETRNKEVITELLKRGAFLGVKNKSNVLAIEDMYPSVLKDCFDSCISTNEIIGISMKYNNLRNMSTRGCQQQKEMPFLAYMAKDEDFRHLLEHPLITSFLHLKWNQLSPIFYVNLMLFILFAISIVTHTVLKFSGGEATSVTTGFRIMSWIGIVYMIGRECIQLATMPRQYFRSITNYLELILIVLAIMNCKDLGIERQQQKLIGVVTLLLIAVELFLLCGCLPVLSMSTHMLMLKEVCKSFLKSFLLYSIFVVTFSLCFYILFGTDMENAADGKGDFNKFTNPLKAVVKTVVMLTGELDAGEIEFSTLYSYLLFLLFVFLMTIVLYNLLNGLAVSDIQTIMGQAKQNCIICRIELLTRYEDVLVGHPVYQRLTKGYSVINHLGEIENGASKGKVPIMNRETLEIALDILEQKRLKSKRQQRLRNNENRFNKIENRLSDIFKRLDSKC